MPEIEQLYLDAFTKGASAQFVDGVELRNYITEVLQIGVAILSTENSTVNACLLYTPLTFDMYCPPQITSKFNLNQSVYIAEIMVSEASRGKGVGRMLIEKFLETIKNQHYTDAFIRVWDENITAINLYQKMGFTPITEIKQLKKSVDGKTDFDMCKIYLHKNLTDLQ